jgi:hypothetical protein
MEGNVTFLSAAIPFNNRGGGNVDTPLLGVVPIQDMNGDNAVDTALLREMCADAKQYLESFDWCEVAGPVYWGGGIGKIFSVFVFEIASVAADVDRLLWVVVGDVPPLYFVLDDCRSPSDVLDKYMELMEQWIELARQGRTSDALLPTSVEPTPEWAASLAKRLQFIRTSVGPLLKK